MFTATQNVVTEPWIVNTWCIATYLNSCWLVCYVAYSDTADIVYAFTNGTKCVITKLNNCWIKSGKDVERKHTGTCVN